MEQRVAVLVLALRGAGFTDESKWVEQELSRNGAEQERRRTEELIARLRENGINPNAL